MSRFRSTGHRRVKAGEVRFDVARGVAFFLGGFIALNLLIERRSARFDANLWLLDLSALASPVRFAVLACAAGALLLFAISPHTARRLRNGVAVFLVPAVAASLVNATVFYVLLVQRTIASPFPVPFTLAVAAAIALVVASLFAREAPAAAKRGVILATVLACALFFPLAQGICYGNTDYRRPADMAIVLGARAYADGTTSPPLRQRVRTSCDLYRAGLAPAMLFSGGPADGGMNETEAMRRLAMKLGVPERAIVLDPAGVSTEATVENTVPMIRRAGARRVLVVSHFYHLPRIKMTYQRYGMNVLTVPARIDRFTPDLLYSMLREVGGLWIYYLRALG